MTRVLHEGLADITRDVAAGGERIRTRVVVVIKAAENPVPGALVPVGANHEQIALPGTGSERAHKTRRAFGYEAKKLCRYGADTTRYDMIACHAGIPSGIGEGLSGRSEEHTSELQSQSNLVCRLLLEK